MGILEKIKDIEFEVRGGRQAGRQGSSFHACHHSSGTTACLCLRAHCHKPQAVTHCACLTRAPTCVAARRWVGLKKIRPRSITWVGWVPAAASSSGASNPGKQPTLACAWL